MSSRLLAALLALFAIRAFADEPFLRPGDVIALVGGEDMVAASEYGYLELLLTRALPEHKLKFRCLAWEGDTVFEQRRDLNYPTLEQQLDQIKATVVIAQFGQMESLAGKEKLPEFIAAYEKLIERMSGRGKRRLLLLAPQTFGEIRDDRGVFGHHRSIAGVTDSLISERNEVLTEYRGAIRNLPQRRGAIFVDPALLPAGDSRMPWPTRDGVHLTDFGHSAVGQSIAAHIAGESFLAQRDADFAELGSLPPTTDGEFPVRFERNRGLVAEIVAKNRLWFHYYRPQNWAFLAGDRTNQPSSRDHRDPSKRWFPEELEQFLPLIEKKETEIWKMAAELAKEK